jgi:hypothetical protein
MDLGLAVYIVYLIWGFAIVYFSRYIGVGVYTRRILLLFHIGIGLVVFPFFLPPSWFYVLVYKNTSNGTVPVYVYQPERSYLLAIPLTLGVATLGFALYMLLEYMVRSIG